MLKREGLEIGDPYVVQFNLLSACVLNCEYCYLRSLKKNSDVLDVFDIHFFLDELSIFCEKYVFGLYVNISGGDLWLYPKLNKLKKVLLENENVKKIALLLNSLWSPDSKDFIMSLQEKLDCIQLNVDLISNPSEDLEFLFSKNIFVVVKIMISNNEDYFRKQITLLQSLLKKYPLLKYSVDRLCPSEIDQIKNVCSNIELQRKIKIVRNLKKENFIMDDPILCLNEDNEENSIVGCSIPNGSVTVFPDGKIKLCARIPNFETGYNVRNFDLLSYINKYQNIRESLQEHCSGCKFENKCNGGCLATSYVSREGKFIKPDINCIRNE